jgi:hypothetical protein
VDTTRAGNDGYLITEADGLPNMGQDWGVALLDGSGAIVQFIAFKDPITAVDGPAAGQSSTYAFNDASRSGDSMETTDQGATYQVQGSPNPGTIPCFAPGTLIDTPDGPRPVEDLAPGDPVTTRDAGAVPILWAARRAMALDHAGGDPAPVLIRAGALGPGLPARDLVVSPQHRILVGEAGQLERQFGRPVLVPAKALAGLPGIRRMPGKRHMDWVHFACARHALVTSNGCVTESLLLGRMVLARLSRFQRLALAETFGRDPGARSLNGPAARPRMGYSAAVARLARIGAATAARADAA